MLKAIPLAVVISLSSTLAFAQAGSGSGATVPEKSGAAVNGGSGVVGTTNNGLTTGTSRPSPGDASTQGAGTAGSAEKAGADATSPGGTMKPK